MAFRQTRIRTGKPLKKVVALFANVQAAKGDPEVLELSVETKSPGAGHAAAA